MGLRYTAGFDGFNAYTKQFHNYEVEIYDVNYIGEPKEIEMGANPMEGEFSNTSNGSFPTLIPSFLDLNLIATESFQLNEMYTDDEKALKVVMKMDGVVYGNYFVIPDGTSESFIDPPYDVSVRCTDGLGILDGYNYPEVNGKASVLEVITKCLNQLGLEMSINTYSDIHYSGLSVGEDVFLNTIINQEQFADDKEVPMNCNKVLESLLSSWVCGLVQQGGDWYLFRWPDIVRNEGEITFKKYDYELNLIGDNTINIDKVLGNGSGDAIHCKSDQIRAVNMPYKRVSIKYDYGFLLNLLDRMTSNFTGFVTEFYGWDKVNGIDASPATFVGEVAEVRGVTMPVSENRAIVTKEEINVSGLSKARMELTFNLGTGNSLPYLIALWDGTKFMNLEWNNKWVTVYGTGTYFTNYIKYKDGKTRGLGEIVRAELDFDLPPGLLSDAYLVVRIYPVIYLLNNVDFGDPGLVKLYNIKMMPVSNSRSIISETFTVVNSGNYSKVPDEMEVMNGETDFYGYKGSMFKSDGDTLTNGFKHRDESTYVNFIELAAKDILFQHGQPMNRYEGSTIGIYGFLSRFTINSLSGNFMPVSMRVNFKECVSKVVMSEVSNEEVPHTVMPVIYEYEETKQEGVKDVE
jgi:hypothetical protein